MAIDLRFILANMKIGNSLEKIADTTVSIARYVLESNKKIDTVLLDCSQIEPMLDVLILMLMDVHKSYELEDTKIARKVFKSDAFLNKVNNSSVPIICEYLI